MRINRYDEFIKEAKTQGKMMIFYSNEFREILLNIVKYQKDNQTARFLLAAEESNQALDTYTLIDKTDKNDMISYVQTSRLQREYNLNSDDMELYKVTNTDKFWKQGRTPYYSIGRWVRHIYADVHGSPIENTQLENFVNAYKFTYDNMEEPLDGFELVKGEDIRKWYLEDNYQEVKGQLGNSCMRYATCQKYLDIYTENTEVCELLILKGSDPEKIIGRALIWTLKDGSKYMDRIYTMNDSDILKFEKYAKEKDYDYYKSTNNKSKSVKIKSNKYEYYPYMDTFFIYDSENGILYSHNSSKNNETLSLRNTDGTATYNTERVWSSYEGEYIDDEDARYCEDIDGYAHYDNTIYLEYVDCYVTTSANVVWSEYEENYYYREDTVHSKCMDDNLVKDSTDTIQFKTNERGDTDYCSIRTNEFYTEVDGEYYSKNYKKNPYTGKYEFFDKSNTTEIVEKLQKDLGKKYVSDEDMIELLTDDKLEGIAYEMGNELIKKIFRYNESELNIKEIIPFLYSTLIIMSNRKNENINDYIWFEAYWMKLIRQLTDKETAEGIQKKIIGMRTWQYRKFIDSLISKVMSINIYLFPEKIYKSILLRQIKNELL